VRVDPFYLASPLLVTHTFYVVPGQGDLFDGVYGGRTYALRSVVGNAASALFLSAIIQDSGVLAFLFIFALRKQVPAHQALELEGASRLGVVFVADSVGLFDGFVGPFFVLFAHLH